MKKKTLSEGHVVQVGLGNAVVDAIREFASADIKSVQDLENEMFKHVRDKDLRKRVAETFYGARWLYKLGLVTLVTGTLRAAHVRAQVIDYGAICEALLLDAIAHGVAKSHLKGSVWLTGRHGEIVSWPAGLQDIRHTLRKKRNFRWMIQVAMDEHMFTTDFGKNVDWLRERRNDIHIAEMAAKTEKAYLNTSKRAYDVVTKCTERVDHWMSMHR